MILMNNFKAEPANLRESMLDAVRRVLESGWYVLGPEVEAFEQLWAKACGTDYGVGVGNGMDAIEIALRALDVGPGDEVITTPMTAFASVLAILRTGATPVLADIDSNTALMDIASVKRCISPKTKVILLVHLYGQLCNMEAWTALCEAQGITLVEDCAQAHLASWNGRNAGSFGAAGAYSFYPTKNLGAPGDAGLLVTSDPDLDQRARRLRNYGQSVRYSHSEIGMNSRMDEIHAAMLSARLRWLPEFTARRRQIASIFQTELRNSHVWLLSAPHQPMSHVYHLFVVNCTRRDALMAHLYRRQVQSLIHYPIPIHLQQPCLKIARDTAGLPKSEYHAQTCLSLPCHPLMSDNDVAEVIAAVNSFSLV